ncbi:MAG TPA: hypothetical protein VKN18_20035 [Blastocatellia bacterium]|nr:hypothetical protein [Blastocatellia bacterium]
MTIAEATQRFTESHRLTSTVQPTDHLQVISPTLLLLERYFSHEADLSEITPVRLRDLVARWYVEEASTSRMIGAAKVEGSGENDGSGTGYSRPIRILPEPVELLDELERFLKWMDMQTSFGDTTCCLSILTELRETLPQALEINHSLSTLFKKRHSAFSFPEFLTSFEEGGSSQYDIDAPGISGAIDGFFRIIRVEGNRAEAQEVISDERISPIIFPNEVAKMLNSEYVINLEIVRDRESWKIAECGFTYPPNTEF